MPSCSINPASEEVADFIYRSSSAYTSMDQLENYILCHESASREYEILYFPLASIPPLSLVTYYYYSIPKLYTLLDTSSMEAAGILPIFQQPALNNRGEGVLIGLIDTGIDYQNPLFKNLDGTTRIAGIWDQTLSADPSQPASASKGSQEDTIEVLYGTAFTSRQINEALRSDRPLDIVPSIDAEGHGTFMAGIAAGGQSPSGDFIGAAPKAAIGMVKLKPAKKYLRDFFLIQEDASAYQENDIMTGVRYLTELAHRLHMPLALCISLGSNSGSHEGTTPLGQILQASSQSIGTINIIAGGNETGLSHHYLGNLPSGQNSEDVEIRVAEGERGFVTEFWSNITDLYTVGFISPSGETISRIPMTLGRETKISFLLEPTIITINYLPNESGSGRQLIFFRFENPTAGVWRIRVYNSLYLNGRYHMWLPVESFCKPETIFLRPNPDTTITNPGNARFPLTISAYNHVDGSIYLHSSRGFTINEQIKPDLAAPGVNVYGPTVPPVPANTEELPMTRKSGSSVSAAHAAGAVANLLSWGLVAGNDMTMSTSSVRGYLVRGAKRTPGYEYPNREFGYGTLDLYQSFLDLRE